ncbi:hypothetical protein C2G38_2227816 [Gigaspora rosea]|uniref:SWIM-type domain-containing protein n=1 Tax=Gigaspora rosea TaxID=44941 RepID=A0A397U088_9GLOM|nr:hypothetical protein C2G38_2227816 [Gigaspora rosea]
MDFFFDGSIVCERACGGLEEYRQECSNFFLKNNLKNAFDMHKCAVRVITKGMLSNVEDSLPVQLIISGVHKTSILPTPDPKFTRINLSLQTRDKVIAARRAYRNTGVEIAIKMLKPHNNSNETHLTHLHKTNQLVTTDLKEQGKMLYYQCGDTFATINSFERYYQLTISDEIWLKQGRDCGQFCFGIDGKYDLNNEKAPVLAIGMGFRRQLECTSNWNLLAMMDKHRPTKLALQGLIRETILCRSKTDEEAVEMGEEYSKSINSLSLDNNTKDYLIRDLRVNWICNEWRKSFIDGGRIYDQSNAMPMTTNNLTERMHKTVEARELGKTNFDAGLATYWNMRTIEHKQMPPKNSVDKKLCINQGRFYVLLGFVIPIPGQANYMLVEKQNKVFYSLYTFHPINIPTNISEKINEIIVKLVNRENLYIPETCYLVNTLSGECTCYDYIWNGPFRDFCKHVHATRQYTEALREKLQMQEIKEKLVQYFKDKENVVVPEKKNYIIHRGTKRKTIANDPFCPIDSIQIPSTSRAPKNNGAKFRKPSQFSSNMQIENSQEYYNENFSDLTITEITEISEIPISDIENVDPHSIRRRNTTRVRNKCQTHSQAIYSNRQENDTAFTTKRSLEELFLEKKCGSVIEKLVKKFKG